MEFEDKALECKNCGKRFIWSADEQKFFQTKGFQHQPARCPECRKAFREKQKSLMNRVSCSNCGKYALVPFAIQKDKPIYCQDCFNKVREQNKS